MGRRAGTPWARALGVVALIGIAAAALAPEAEAQGTWAIVAPMPTARAYAGAGVVDGKLYAAGGSYYNDTAVEWTYLATTDVYDPVKNTWAAVAPMSTVRVYAGAGVVDGKLYALGGYDPVKGNLNAFDTVEVYDPATDTWAAVAPMPTARGMLAAGVVDSKLYAVGGAVMNNGGWTVLANVEVYDPATNTWAAVASMPTARKSLASAVVGGKLYALGGSSFGCCPDNALATVEMYDTATNTWTTVAPMPTARYGLVAEVVGGKLYAAGGYHSVPVDNAIDTVEVYNPAANKWAAVTPMPTARYGLVAGVLGGKLYAAGGSCCTQDDENPLDVLEVLEVPGPRSLKTAVVIGAAAGGVALLASVAAAIVIKRRRALYRQQAARLTMARASASPSLASI